MSASWQDRVSFSVSGAFAFRPGQVLVDVDSSDQALALLRERFVAYHDPPSQLIELAGRPVVGYQRIEGDFDVELAVAELRSHSIMAQPNHVLFGHGFEGYPFSGNPFSGNPFSGNPFSGNPFSGNPFSGNPYLYFGNQYSQLAYPDPALLRGGGYATHGQGRNLARPAPPLALGQARPHNGGTPKMAILDVALPDLGPDPSGKIWCPWLVDRCGRMPPGAAGGLPDEDVNGWLDRIAGHGMFVAGRIALVEPNSSIIVMKALANAGDGSEQDIAESLSALVGDVDIVNLSFGGYALEHMDLVARAIRELQSTPSPASAVSGSGKRDSLHGAVVVASAGNDATSYPPYPAILPGVVSVGALGPDGPAPFTNFGPWVRACAAGVDVTSTFFQMFDGPVGMRPDGDPDKFEGAATWSGTSFSAPFVAGRIAQLVRANLLLPKEAVSLLLDSPGLARIPGLGTIVT